jgi:hypothetical protein
MPKKKKKQSQKQIAEAAFEQLERRRLQRQIKLLNRLPNDFRDIEVGSPDWEAFADATNRRQEMESWSNGLTICFEEPSKHEKRILGKIKLVDKPTTAWEWFGIFRTLSAFTASWLYLPEEEGPFIAALNVMFSRIGACFRARGPVLSEHSGKRIGVVH